MRFVCATILLLGASQAAAAQEWTATVTGSGSQSDADGSPLISSGSVSLERQFEKSWFGGVLGASQGETNVPEVDASIDQQSLEGGLWWGVHVGDYDLTLAADYARQTIDGGWRMLGVHLTGDGETRSSSVSATVARTFGERRSLTPSLALRYDDSKTDLDVSFPSGAVLKVSQDANGFSGEARLDASLPLSNDVSLLAGAAFVAVENAAASGVALRDGSVRPRQREQEGAAQWGEASLGLEFATSEKTALLAQFGSTVGRDNDEAFASVSLQWSF